MRVKYIEYAMQGAFVSDMAVTLLKDTVIPHGCYAYRLFEVEEITVGDETLKGERKNAGGWIYIPGAKVLTPDDVAPKSTLGMNMECNNWKRVVEISTGQVFPLNDEDVVLVNEAKL